MALNLSQRAARVYAEAMIAIGEEQGNLPTIHEELEALGKLYDEDRDFRGFFTSPRLDRDRKIEILMKLFRGEVSKPVLGLLHVLVMKGRELLLDNVVDHFARFRDLREGRVHVQVRTARTLADDQKAEIVARVEAMTGKTAELHERVEPELLGGTIVRVGDYVVDGSLRRKLVALKKSMVAKERIFD